MKRLFLILLAGLVFLSGCSQTGAVQNKPVKPGRDGRITDEPLELTVHMHWQNIYSFQDDFAVFQEAFQRTNVRLKGTAATTNLSSIDSYDLMMASGKLPDIISYIDYNRMMSDGKNGFFIPLNELIEQYAPNIKKFFDENPDVRKSMTASDGNIYALPSTNDSASKAGLGYMIRKDWLDKLNLRLPDTMEELYIVLKAFRDEDPNGNGFKDEIPFFTRTKGSLPFVMSFGAKSGLYIDNGKVKFGPSEKEYYEGMRLMSLYYEEGLLDKEIFSRGANAREVLFGENRGGMTYDWFSSTSVFNDKLTVPVPGFELVPLAPPKAADGIRRCEFSREPLMTGMGWGISSACLYPVEAIKYMDFWLSAEGKQLFSFGIDGIDYTMQDGKAVFTDKVLKNELTPVAYLNSRGAILPTVGSQISAEYEKQAMHESGREGFLMYETHNNYNYYERMPLCPVADEAKEQYKKISETVHSILADRIQRWVIGVEKLDWEAWEAYLAELRKAGFEEMIAIQQNAYDAYCLR